MINVYIPSYRRAKEAFSATKTLSFIPKEDRISTYMVVREEEVEDYIKNGFGACRFITIPSKYIKMKEAKNERPFLWADTMDFILEQAIRDNVEHAVICDDDLMFYKLSEKTGSLVKMTHDDWPDLIRYLKTADARTPLKAVGFRGFANAKTSIVNVDSPVNGFFCFYMPVIEDKHFRFCSTQALHMADRHMVLNLLCNGFHTETTQRFVFNTVMDTKGGCSVNRSPQDHSRSALMLAKQYPSVVELKIKTNLGDSRIATNIRWKEAFDLYAREGKNEDI